MTGEGSLLFVFLVSLFTISGLLFVLKLLQLLSQKRGKDRERRRWGGLAVALVGMTVCVVVYLTVVLPSGSQYVLNVAAIRATNRDVQPVDLSLWVYDTNNSVIKKVFTPGKLDPRQTGTSWVSLDDGEFTVLPKRTISDEGLLTCEVKLNPNRLATPPDARFVITIDLSEVLESSVDPITYQARSLGTGDFELKVLIDVH